MNKPGLPRIVHRVVWIPVYVGLLLFSIGCGTDGMDTSYLKDNWETFTSENFVFYIPPDSPRLTRVAEFAETCEEICTHLCRVLQIELDRSIELFVFNTDVQSDSLIGRPTGFFEPPAIFIRIGQHPGGYVAQAVCHSIDEGAPSFDILKTGMYQLYAQPGVNVHSETFAYERQQRFIPLADLADTVLVKDPSVYHAEAASFCAYLLANFGPDRFKMLWSSTLAFPESMAKIYGTDLDRFEEEWRKYYRRESTRT